MKIQEVFKRRSVRIVLLCLAALILLFAAWKVFGGEDKQDYKPTEKEAKLAVLLSRIEGVERATVLITEKEGTAVSAVVLFYGEDGILLRTRLMEVAASALALSTRDILVYPAQ